MPIKGGRGVNGKITYIKLDDFDDSSDLMEITQTDRDILLILSEQLDWKNRWLEPPAPLDDDDARDEYVSNLKLRLMEVINFCERMIECITSDTDVQQALVNWLIQALAENENLQQAVTNVNYYNNYTGLPSKPGTSGNLLLPADCIKDNAAGYVMTGIVDRAFDNIYQMFDVMILATTDEQKKAAVLRAIPALGELLDFLAVTDTITFVANISGWIKAQFEAEDNEDLRFKYYRDLLCLYLTNGCELSIENIRDYFWKQATEANSGFNDAIGTAIDLYNFLFNGTADSFVGIAPVLMAVQFGGAYFVDSLFNMPLAEFKMFATLGEPTDDWIAWEFLYGECECYEVYTPDNTTYEVLRGIIGIEGVFCSSDIETSGGARHQVTVTFEDLDVTGAIAIEFITNRPIINGASGVEFTVAGVFSSPNNATNSYYVSPDKWGIRIDLDPAVTDSLEDIVIRQNIGDVTNDFSFVEFRIYYPC